MKLNKNKLKNVCSVQLMTVENNDEGRSLIKTVRKQMKGSPLRLVLRGRGHRPSRSYQGYLPLSMSNRITVYLVNRIRKNTVGCGCGCGGRLEIRCQG